MHPSALQNPVRLTVYNKKKSNTWTHLLLRTLDRLPKHSKNRIRVPINKAFPRLSNPARKIGNLSNLAYLAAVHLGQVAKALRGRSDNVGDAERDRSDRLGDAFHWVEEDLSDTDVVWGEKLSIDGGDGEGEGVRTVEDGAEDRETAAGYGVGDVCSSSVRLGACPTKKSAAKRERDDVGEFTDDEDEAL
jgi:hypothetical protein